MEKKTTTTKNKLSSSSWFLFSHRFCCLIWFLFVEFYLYSKQLFANNCWLDVSALHFSFEFQFSSPPPPCLHCTNQLFYTCIVDFNLCFPFYKIITKYAFKRKQHLIQKRFISEQKNTHTQTIGYTQNHIHTWNNVGNTQNTHTHTNTQHMSTKSPCQEQHRSIWSIQNINTTDFSALFQFYSKFVFSNTYFDSIRFDSNFTYTQPSFQPPYQYQYPNILKTNSSIVPRVCACKACVHRMILSRWLPSTSAILAQHRIIWSPYFIIDWNQILHDFCWNYLQNGLKGIWLLKTT